MCNISCVSGVAYPNPPIDVHIGGLQYPIIFKIKLPSVGSSIEMSRMSRCFAQQISPCLVPRGHFGSAASAGRVVPKDLLRLDDSISCGSWDMKQQQLGYWMLLGYFDIWNMEFRSLLLDDKR